MNRFQKLLDAIRLEQKSSSLNDDPKSLAHLYIQEMDNDPSSALFSGNTIMIIVVPQFPKINILY